jgi:hypothetical protein
VGLVNDVSSGLPEEQLRYLSLGGFDVPLDSAYSDLEKYQIRQIGRFLRALANGVLMPAYPVQKQFVQAVRGEVPATSPVETAWIRFRAAYPELAASTETP